MFYIHQTYCISPQQTFDMPGGETLAESVGNKLNVIEPAYEGIPKGILRRMGKSVRIGVGAAMPLVQSTKQLDGIIIGTANGGMEESVIFLKQIVEYNEDMLAPGNFVQSTSNAIASQLALSTGKKGYNVTHVHRGLAFENAAIDAAMALNENKQHHYLLAGVDDISSYNYKLDYLDGWYKKDEISSRHLYDADTPGTIAGEGAAVFLVSNEAANAIAKVEAITTLYTADASLVCDKFKKVVDGCAEGGKKIDLVLTGENGDNRFNEYYACCEALMDERVAIARFKHMCGEYPTASAFALWLACQLLAGRLLPMHMVKKAGMVSDFENILIYNNHKGVQHSFIAVSKA